MSILVLSQDQKVFRIFDDAGIKAVKVTSAAAAILLLKDSDVVPEIVFLDDALKGLNDIRRTVFSKSIKHFVIGQEIPRPLRVEHIQQIISNTAIKLCTNDSHKSEQRQLEKDILPDTPKAELNRLEGKDKTLQNFLDTLQSNKIKREKITAPQPYFIQQQVIALLRVKGGVGATILAAHLARYLETQVCIIDLNFSDGGSDLSGYLNLPVVPHWGIFLRNKNKNGFNEALVSRDNVHILQAPPGFKLIENINIDDINRAINYAKKKFNIIILDLPNILNDLSREALDFATTTMVVSSGHLSELARIEKIMAYLENPVIVLNREGVRSVKHFQEYLGVSGVFCIEEDSQLFACTEKRKFCPAESPFGRGINRLCEYILRTAK